MSDAKVSPTERLLPDVRLAGLRHLMTLPDTLYPEKEKVREELTEAVKANHMLPFYRGLCSKLGWIPEEGLVDAMEDVIAKRLVALDAAIDDAKANLGDVEVRDAILEKAHFYCGIGDKENATTEYERAHAVTTGAGGKLDIILTLIRLALFEADSKMVATNIDRAKVELEKGGDWERRNKHKIYEGLHLLSKRLFAEAAVLFNDSLATFAASELVSFEDFVFYTVLTGMLTLDRPALKTKILASPEVLAVASTDKTLEDFMRSFYDGNYALFIRTLIPICKRVQMDRYMGQHYRYFVRNIRLRAYAQFLEPFRSVVIESMARQFGVGEEFIEKEVSSFIASGKLAYRIDRVRGVIESNRLDTRNQLYADVIKEGDLLLNRIQKLSRVLDM